MSTISSRRAARSTTYPTTDGKPMAETDLHRDLMIILIETLRLFFAPDPRVYVSGNLLLYYQRGNRRRHVSPDVFVVRGVENHRRENYLLWEEGIAPQTAVELTSSSTQRQDTGRKFQLYRDVLRVREYFLFDPRKDYLSPRLRGYRLRAGEYRPIRPVEGRLPSQTLGLHLEESGESLRLFNPATGLWLPTPGEERSQLLMENEELRRELERFRNKHS